MKYRKVFIRTSKFWLRQGERLFGHLEYFAKQSMEYDIDFITTFLTATVLKGLKLFCKIWICVPLCKNNESSETIEASCSQIPCARVKSENNIQKIIVFCLFACLFAISPFCLFPWTLRSSALDLTGIKIH